MDSTILMLTTAIILEGLAIIFLTLRIVNLEKYVNSGFEHGNKTFDSIIDALKRITNKINQ